MDAIITPPTKELIARLQADHPTINFVAGTDFHWSAPLQSVTFDPRESNHGFLLHELGHAILGHNDYHLDVEHLAQEREAWSQVRTTLAPLYNIQIDETLIEDALDTYRDWLDARSRCPSCGLTGLQNKTSTYVCVNCRCSWRPNDARQCALRRYVVSN